MHRGQRPLGIVASPLVGEPQTPSQKPFLTPCIYMGMATATTRDKRKDFGEVIPGARKERADKVRDAMGDLASMRDSGVTFAPDQLRGKLMEIRRDDIWGPLEEKLEGLKDRDAGPALALAWRTLYEVTAASAGSTHLKPASFALSAADAYIFSVCYKTVLEDIEDRMAELSLDATWSEITDAVLAHPTSSYPMNGLSGSHMVTEVNLAMLNPPEGSQYAELDAETAAQWWLSQSDSSMNKFPIYLVAKKSRYADPLAQAKYEILDKYAVFWRSEALSLAAGFAENKDAEYGARAFLMRCMTESRQRADYVLRISHRQSEALGTNIFDLGQMYDDLWATIAHRADFDPWTTIRQRKLPAQNTEGESEETANAFESVVVRKITPVSRFEHLKRETKPGAPSPRQGDVTEADLTDLVPFRGIQYGNWATQAERQEMLNLAYDAMSDLALALGVSTEYLALPVKDGAGTKNLGLALGARGRGGRALAHYEAGQHVVNLTKTKGGGSLAHEWMHAYDHKLASDLGLGLPFASDASGNRISEFVKRLSRLSQEDDYSQHKETIAQMRLDGMVEMLLTPDIEKKLFEASGGAEHWKSFGEAVLKTLGHWAESNTPVLDYACSTSKSSSYIIDHEVVCTNMRQGLIDNGVPQAAAQAVSETWSGALSGSTWINLHKRVNNKASSRYGKTAYFLNAEMLDRSRSKPYWSSPTELFARAGSAVVFDRLREAHGISNGFLDASSDPGNFDRKLHKANENPSGAERTRFREIFSETLIAEMVKQDIETKRDLKPEAQLQPLQLRFGF